MCTVSAYTSAIKVFELEAERIRKEWVKESSGLTLRDALPSLLRRDDALEECQWAIQLLHNACLDSL